MKLLVIFSLLSFLALLQVTQAQRNCNSNVCLNDGLCIVNDASQTFECICREESNLRFTGTLCETVIPCDLKCQNGGNCMFDESDSPVCNCTIGFTGEFCTDTVTDCQIMGCPENEICLADQSNTKFNCEIDYCAKQSPCRNNATCRPSRDGYLCECLLGYSGKTCEDDLNECDFNPCKNDGVCLNTVGSYKCVCRPGFGEICNTKIGFCLPNSNACGEHSTCVELGDSYRCDCHTGYTGAECETELQCTCVNPKHECMLVDGKPLCQCPSGMQGDSCDEPIDLCAEKNECQNGGQCIPNGNKTFCVCSSRYSGHFCEYEIEEECLVEGKSCENGQCRSISNGPYCECPSNYTGKWCEQMVSAAANTVHPGNISSRSCPNGFAGQNCDLECGCESNELCRESLDHPGTTECLRVSTNESTSSLFPTPSTLKHVDITTFETTQTNEMGLPATSISSIPTKTSSVTLTLTSMPTKFPFISSDLKNITNCDECVHAHKCLKLDSRLQCLCQSEYSGSVCDLPIQPCQTIRCSNGQVCRLRRTRKGDIPFCGCPPGLAGPTCRTPTTATLKMSTIFIHQMTQMLPNLRSQSYFLEFSFRTTVPNVHFASGETIIGQVQYSIGLNQGQLALNLSTNHVYGLLDLPLNDADWYTVKLFGNLNGTSIEIIEAASGYLLTKRQFPRQPWGVYTTRIGKRDEGSYMVGCLRDVSINQQPVDLFDPERSIDITSGCDRHERCAADTCQNSAKCIDLWSEHRCDCLRPFLAPDCIHKLQEATFGHKNQSTSVKFSASKEEASNVRQFTDLSFLVRTNAENGPIIYLGENGNDDVGTFLSTEIANGKLRVNTRLGGKNVISKTSGTEVNDNNPHLVQIMRQNNDIKVSIDGKREFVITLNWPFEHPLLMDSIVMGDSNAIRPEAFSSKIDYFKGTLQDIRLNDRSIILDDNPPDFDVEKFGQKVSSENLLKGTVSDDVCASTRCQHGECRNTFNDFECLCEVGWMGRDCSLRDFCSNTSCGDGTTCKNSHNGYVCVGPASFAPTSTIRYNIFFPEKPWITPKENNFTFEIRTRSTTGHVFKLQSSTESLWLQINEKNLIFGYTNMTSSSLKDPLAFDLTDGEWHLITIFMQSNSKIYANFDNISTVPLLAPFSFNRFLMDKTSRVTLGKSYNSTGFKGCLRNVRLNNLPEFSFLRKDNFGGFLEETVHFVPEAREHIRADGCHSAEVCGRINPCKNGATCVDLFELQECECQPGFEGQFCEININDCETFDGCNSNGVCLDGLNEQSCVCKPGYTGLKCENMEDKCVPNPCQNGANCRTIDGEFSCQCPTGFFGHRCQQKQSVRCAENPCENGAKCIDLTQNSILCSCAEGFTGVLCDIPENSCREMPCKNGGICSTTNGNLQCQCPIGYGGPTCAEFVDTCTFQKPCVHGQCSNIWNGFLCECDEGWRGSNCDIPVDFCMDFPCDNNGTCLDAGSSFRCECAKYFMGNLCEIQGVCATGPCVHGECVQHSQNDYSCNCFKGYRGSNCEEQIDYCLNNPCKNGATCEKLIGDYSCKCILGFTGKDCGEDINDCTKDSCAHGICIDRVNGFDCNCTNSGFQGRHCEEDIDECAQSEVNCIHGLCKNLPGSYECKCFQGFIGPKCNMVNPCLPDAQNRTLHNCVHGKCVNPIVVRQPSGREVATHECDCFEGFEGPQCSHIVEKHHALALGYILGPVAAILLVLCLLGCMLFFFVARNKRANQGTYSPSTQEMTGAARNQMPVTIHKVPLQERLI